MNSLISGLPMNSSVSSLTTSLATNDSKVSPKKILKIGVCAMDNKARSKPCQNILKRVISGREDSYEIIVFGDKMILDEEIQSWPVCDILIAFFSKGFPLDKCISYIRLRRPFCVNSVPMQKILLDRRIVLRMLDALQVNTPPRIICSRDGGPRISKDVESIVKSRLGIQINTEESVATVQLIDDDTISINGKTMTKPFIEKPVDGEDHNIYIYYAKSKGGGGRRLFRKIGNKSSEFDSSLNHPRMDGSYIYEKFMEADNCEDVKVYTVTERYCHAETRKSPSVDGIVRRNSYGKEIRFVYNLSEQEKKIAGLICNTFQQTFCGFDMLRCNGKFYVIDINGFSFVKDNNEYYDQAAYHLTRVCDIAKEQLMRKSLMSLSLQEQIAQSLHPPPSEQSAWKVKGIIMVIRHADRTPKQKLKFNFKSQPFVDLLCGHQEEVIIRESHLQYVQKAVQKALALSCEDRDKLLNLNHTLMKKISLPGTKVQLKPSYAADGETLEKLQVILKWGGEFTHSARYQSRDLGENVCNDLMILNKKLLCNAQIYSSSERRVSASAEIFAMALFQTETIPEDRILIHKTFLDDSNAAKDKMNLVKKKLKSLIREGVQAPPQFAWPKDMPQPHIVVQEVVELLKYHRDVMIQNYHDLDEKVNDLQSRWCCNEDPFLFRERWEKLFGEFCESEKLDPAKISELYDTMKYDALHNKVFLNCIFSPDVSSTFEKVSLSGNNSDKANNDQTFWEVPSLSIPAKLRELYRLTKILFDLVSPQEYGIENHEKQEIGYLTCMPLLSQVIQDLRNAQESRDTLAKFYFTKESHIYTLLNCIMESDIRTKMDRTEFPELDYLTQITFELSERTKMADASDPLSEEKKEFAVRVLLSPGCYSQNPLDMQLDAKHCISVAPRRSLTSHLDVDEFCTKIKNKFQKIELPKRFIPVMLSTAHGSNDVNEI